MHSQEPVDSPKSLAIPRLSREDTFQFECGPHVRCFTECCARLELRLTPYDVLRLRQRLGISSEAFLDRYTITQLATENGFPQFIMKMGSTGEKRCPFVTESGYRFMKTVPRRAEFILWEGLPPRILLMGAAGSSISQSVRTIVTVSN